MPEPLKVHESEIKMYENLLKKEVKEYAILGGCECTMFEVNWYLRGLENFLTDLYLNKDFAIELLDITMDYLINIYTSCTQKYTYTGNLNEYLFTDIVYSYS